MLLNRSVVAFVVLFLGLVNFKAFGLEPDFHAYLRAGTGSNLKGGKQECFNNSGSAGNEFRLGNECSIYGELSFRFNLIPKAQQSKVSSFLNLTYAFTADNKADWEAGTNQWVPRQIYVEAWDLQDGRFGIWAGKRFYRWGDIYLFDFYPIDYSGPGFGITDYKTPVGTYQMAIIQNAQSKEYSSGSAATNLNIKDAAKTTVHLRAEGLHVFADATTDLWVSVASTPPANDGTTNYKSGTGIALAGKNNFATGFGSGELGLSLGKGVLSNLSSSGELVKDCSDLTDAKCTAQDSQRLRLWISALGESAKWAFQTGAIFDSYNKATTSKSNLNWLSLGFQPVYFITDRFQLASVFGISQAEEQSDNLGSRNLWRITVAPQWAPERSFWSRPVLRAYYTLTGWNNENVSKFSSTSYAGKTQAHAVGVQTEIWF